MDESLSQYLDLIENKSLDALKSIYVTASKSFVKELACLELGLLCSQEIIDCFKDRKQKQTGFYEPLIVRQRNQPKYISIFYFH